MPIRVKHEIGFVIILARVNISNLYKTYRSSAQVVSTNDKKENISLSKKTSTPELKHSQTEDSGYVLKSINLEIKDGEFMVLVGPSGCGKSTLLRLIAGLEEITAGKIQIGDRLVNNLPPKERDIAMVFQNYALYPHLSVYDNIAFGLRRMKKRKSWSVQKTSASFLTKITSWLPPRWQYLCAEEKKLQVQVFEVAKMLQIDHLLTRLPKELSGGQKQRVALGRAIARNPQAFLMDEPLSNLDAKLRTETRLQIVKLQRQLQTTTIYVTHDQTEAMTMGDRIAVMYGGQIQQLATPLQVYHRPVNKFVAQFIGTPPMNILEVEYQQPDLIKHTHFQLPLSAKWQGVFTNYNFAKVWLGIRPEHFQIAEPASAHLTVIVNLIEALGNETILTVNLENDPNTSLQVKLFSNQLISRGEKISLSVDLDAVHFFDYYQEQNIHSLQLQKSN